MTAHSRTMPRARGPSSESLQGRNPREVEHEGCRGRYLWGIDGSEDAGAAHIGETGFACTKDIGTELCYLRNARAALKQLITPIIVETENI